jgi:hypothetical protein
MLLPEGLMGEVWETWKCNDLKEIEDHWIENIFPLGFNVILFIPCRNHNTLTRIIIVQTADIYILLYI